MKKCAVFGSKGYLGKQLCYYLPQHDVECDGFDLPECDIADPHFWERFAPTSYDAILFFSGLTGTEKGFSEATKYVMVNEVGLLNLLNKLAPLGERAPKIIFPSTRLVYKGSECPLSEDAPKAPRTVYAVNKLACEGYLDVYANRYGIRYAVVRICVPYGNLISADYSYGTVGFFLKQAKSGSITLYGDGLQRRTFTHIIDICDAVMKLAQSNASGVYNVGGQNLSLVEAAEHIAKSFDAEIKMIPWSEPAKKIESGSTAFLFDKLALTIGQNEYVEFRAWSPIHVE